MMFVMQFAANQASYTKIMGAEHTIRQMSLISENQGMITSDSVAELKADLADILKCSTAEIDVTIPGNILDTPNSGKEVSAVKFEVSMPVYGVIGPAGVLGINPSQNMRLHKSSGQIILQPQPEEEKQEQDSASESVNNQEAPAA